MNNVEYKADEGKLRLSLVPREIIRAIAKVRMYGAKKYGERGIRDWDKISSTDEETIERYRDAAFRHFLAYLDDPCGTDEESGISHLSHLACNVAFLCELEKRPKAEQETTWVPKKDRMTLCDIEQTLNWN